MEAIILPAACLGSRLFNHGGSNDARKIKEAGTD